MDGVIAVYERNDYIGQNPGYRKPDGHYFLYRPVDTKMAKVLYELYKRGYELHILSNINSDLPETIRSCDYTVCIPMKHGVDSLNVAAASAIAFWQLGRSK